MKKSPNSHLGCSVFFGCSVFSRFGQLYFDYEYAAGDNYQKPWSLSLGFRLSL